MQVLPVPALVCLISAPTLIAFQFKLLAWRVLLFLAISCRIYEFFNLATLNL